MNRTEHLLTIIAEECAEVAQRASKALRFGLSEVEPGQSKTNATRMLEEFNELEAVIDMIRWGPGFSHENNDRDRELERKLNKKKKVERFLAYSVRCGTLDKHTEIIE